MGPSCIWARALPTLSLLPGEVVIKVLPGDKIYQAMEIEQGFMRPAILHGFGTSAKQRLPSRLAELAQFGWLPLAAALFGTVDWQPQWLHHTTIFSLSLAYVFMRKSHRPRSPISRPWHCLVCGSEELQREASAVPSPRQRSSLSVSQQYFAHQRTGKQKLKGRSLT